MTGWRLISWAAGKPNTVELDAFVLIKRKTYRNVKNLSIHRKLKVIDSNISTFSFVTGQSSLLNSLIGSPDEYLKRRFSLMFIRIVFLFKTRRR